LHCAVGEVFPLLLVRVRSGGFADRPAMRDQNPPDWAASVPWFCRSWRTSSLVSCLSLIAPLPFGVTFDPSWFYLAVSFGAPTPPWCEQAPRPVELTVPSLQVKDFADLVFACAGSASARAAESARIVRGMA
jgi:hypothetical protein